MPAPAFSARPLYGNLPQAQPFRSVGVMRTSSSSAVSSQPVSAGLMVGSASFSVHESSSALTHSYGGGQTYAADCSSRRSIADAQQVQYAVLPISISNHRPTAYAVGADLAVTSMAPKMSAPGGPAKAGRPTTGGGDPENPDIHVDGPVGDALLPLLLLLLGYVAFRRRRQQHA